jgi:hypothetical protein
MPTATLPRTRQLAVIADTAISETEDLETLEV